MATHVIGGPHSNASFTPSNGVAARAHVEVQIIQLRARGVKNPRGRLLDERFARHHKSKKR